MEALVSFLDKAGLSAFWNHIKTALIDPISGTNGTLTTHIANKANPHGVTKTQVGLANVTNDAQVKRSEMGKASGVATLGTDGKIPSSQLPSYVDDVIEGYYNPEDEKFYTQKGTDDTYDAANRITGETGKIYVDLTTDDHVIYRYASTSSTYVPISDVPAAVMEGMNDLWDTVNTKADSAKVSALESKVDTKADSAKVSTLESKVNALEGDNSEQYHVLSNIALGLREQGITYDSTSRKLTITLCQGISEEGTLSTQSFEIDGVSDTDINALN